MPRRPERSRNNVEETDRTAGRGGTHKPVDAYKAQYQEYQKSGEDASRSRTSDQRQERSTDHRAKAVEMLRETKDKYPGSVARGAYYASKGLHTVAGEW